MKIRPVWVEPFVSDGQTDAHEANSLISQFFCERAYKTVSTALRHKTGRYTFIFRREQNAGTGFAWRFILNCKWRVWQMLPEEGADTTQ